MSTSCVNVNGSRFKSAMKKFHLSSGTLAGIVSEYMNNPVLQERGHAGFPSDSYIMRKLFPIHTAGKDEIDLYNKSYSKPIVSDDYNYIEGQKELLSKLFNPDDLFIYKDDENHWILKVSRPVPEDPSFYDQQAQSLQERMNSADKSQLTDINLKRTKEAFLLRYGKVLSITRGENGIEVRIVPEVNNDPFNSKIITGTSSDYTFDDSKSLDFKIAVDKVNKNIEEAEKSISENKKGKKYLQAYEKLKKNKEILEGLKNGILTVNRTDNGNLTFRKGQNGRTYYALYLLNQRIADNDLSNYDSRMKDLNNAYHEFEKSGNQAEMQKTGREINNLRTQKRNVEDMKNKSDGIRKGNLIVKYDPVRNMIYTVQKQSSEYFSNIGNAIRGSVNDALSVLNNEISEMNSLAMTRKLTDKESEKLDIVMDKQDKLNTFLSNLDNNLNSNQYKVNINKGDLVVNDDTGKEIFRSRKAAQLLQGNKNGQEVHVNYLDRVISGGQTGMDQIGLETAKENNIQTGGIAPRGFITEYGTARQLGSKYGLVEDTKAGDKEKRSELFKSRTLQNAQNADGTVYFAADPSQSKGIYATREGARMGRKTSSMLVITANDTLDKENAVTRLLNFITSNKIKTLNVAGSRMSGILSVSDKYPSLADDFKEILDIAFKRLDRVVTNHENEGNYFKVMSKDDPSGTFTSIVNLSSDPLYSEVEDNEKKGQIVRMIDEGTLPVSSLIIPTGLDEKTIKLLDSMEKQGINRTAGGNYTVGLKDYEIQQIRESSNLKDSHLFTNSELTDLAKASIYKLSEGITMLQSDRNAAEGLLGKDYAGTDFTSMSRIDIINKVGLSRLLNDIVRERIFNSLKNPAADEDDEICDKMNMIYDNFDSFIRMGYSSLINLEEISFGENRIVENQNTDDRDLLDTDTEQEIQEIMGSSAEAWQTGFRQVSAFSSLSKIIKRELGELYDLNPDTTIKCDGFGIGKLIDPSEATAKILKFVQGAESLDGTDKEGNYLPTSMIAMLRNHIKDEPWLNQLVGSYLRSGNEGDDKVQGILTRKEEGQFKSQFYSNFQKYFQKYTILYTSPSGETRMKVLNKDTYVNQALKEVGMEIASKESGNYPMWDSKNDTLNKKLSDSVNAIIHKMTEETEFNKETASEIKQVYDAFGIPSPEAVSIEELFKNNPDRIKTFIDNSTYLLRALAKEAKKGQAFDPIKNSSSRTNYSNLIGLVSEVMGSNTESVTYQDGKMYYSYVNPGYLGTLVNKLSGHTSDWEDFIGNSYQKFLGWFYNNGGEGSKQAGPSGWLNTWLEELQNKDNRKILNHVVLLTYKGTGYRNLTPAQYMASMIHMFLYDSQEKTAYYRVPIMSNKPSGEYLRFIRYSLGFKDKIASEIAGKTFWQELNRIKAVNWRKTHTDKDQKIKSFDEIGNRFLFMDYLDKYVSNNKSEIGRIINKLIDGKELDQEKVFSNDEAGNKYETEVKGEAAYLEDNLKKVITRELDGRFRQFLDSIEKEGLIKQNGDNISVSDELGGATIDELEQFFWNDHLASINILQLTIADLAYYKDSKDLQKRLAELHSPGLRADVNASDSNGIKYSDGKFRTVYLKDDVVKSDIYSNLQHAFDRVLENPRFSSSQAQQLVKNRMNEFLNVFKEVNVADAQGYSSPTSFRKKMGIFGRWSPQNEEMYQKLLKGDFNIGDLDSAMQVIKPFVYSQISQDGHNPYIPNLKMGIQNKNSEFTLLIADALMRGQGIDNKLSALYDIMEESQGLVKDKDGNWSGTPNGKGIDTIQFESAVKTGLTGALDINNLNRDQIKSLFREKVFNPDGSYNYDYLHEMPFDEYCIQQEIPMHLQGTQQMGSQQRVLSIGDMAENDVNGNVNYITVNDEDEKGNRVERQVSVHDAKQQYFKDAAENIKDSCNDIIKRFSLDSLNTTQKNIVLSRMLQQEILKDSRYGSDMLWACSVNIHGDFNVPLSDPIQAGRIQQLLNSIIKNAVDKQEIAGGPVVQVSNFGTSNDLQVRFQDKNGKLLLTKPEFDRMQKEGTEPDGYADKYVQNDKEYDNYDDYVKDNQDRVAYYECYMTAYDDSLYNDFPDGKGGIDIAKIEKENPRLLEFISYRIPTESKYSMVPGKIVGFLPRECGEGIMYPKEITSFSGSDFDVDKDYVMRYSLQRMEYKDRNAFIDEMKEATGLTASHIKSVIDGDVVPGQEMAVDGKIMDSWQNYQKGKVTYRSFTNGRMKRNNDMLSTQWGMITSRQAQDELFAPGNFNGPKKLGYMMAAINSSDITDSGKLTDYYDRLSKMSIDDLSALNDDSQSLLYADTQMQFHKQNMVAGKLIGVFAQSNVSHIITGFADHPILTIDKDNSFRLGGKKIIGNVPVDSEYGNDGITRESNYLSQLLASSVDAVKDPVLNLMNVNMVTVNAATTLIRLGYDLETVALLCSHPAIRELAMRNGQANENGIESVSQTLKDMMQEITDRIGDFSIPENFNYSKEFLLNSRIESKNETDNDVNNMYILDLFNKLQNISNAFRLITHMTRYNSITSAVGPLSSDTIMSRMEDEEFKDNQMITGDIDEASRKGSLYDTLMNNPMLKGFRMGGYDLSDELLGKNILEASPVFKQAMETLYNTLGYMNQRISRNYLDFFTSYYLNMDNPVFDLSYERRSYIIDNFPLTILKEKERFPENALLKNIILTRDSGNNTLSLSTRGMSTDQIDKMKSSWSDLFKEDPQYAMKLIEYNFNIGSFGFSPRTFMSLVPAEMKQFIPNYISNMGNRRFMSPDELERMNIQFMLNQGTPNVRQVKKELRFDIPENEEESFPVDRKKVTKLNGYSAGVAYLKDENGKGTWCIIKYDPYSKDTYTASRTHELGGINQGFEINPQEEVPETVYKEVEKPVTKGTDEDDTMVKENQWLEEKEKYLGKMTNYMRMVNFMFDHEGQMKFFADGTSNKDQLKLFADKFDSYYINSDVEGIESFNSLIDQFPQNTVDKMQDIMKDLNIDKMTENEASEMIKDLNLCE